MGFSNFNTASIETNIQQLEPNFSDLRKLIGRVYEPMSLEEFNSFLEQARKSGQHLSLAGADGNFIPFTNWFDQLTKSQPDKNFISQLTSFSMQKMNESIKDLVSFFKLDRFCELRALYTFLKTNYGAKAFLSKPNSNYDQHKIDLITQLPKVGEIGFQVKAALLTF